MGPVTIRREAFHGWEDTYRLGNGAIEARVLADVGPRVVELRRPGGPSLFHLRPNELGGRGEAVWRFRGGWRLWIAPERRATTYALDNAPCAVEVPAAGSIRVVGPPQPGVGVRKAVRLALDPERPRLAVESRVTNVGDRAITLAPWTLAALRPGGRAFVPLDVGPPEAFDAVRRVILWSYARIRDPRYRWGDALVEIDSADVPRATPPVVVAPERTSDESKIGVDSTAGWAAYLFDATLLVTRAVVEPGPRADGGATVEVYSSREFVELEHLGPLRTLAPGEDATLREEWWLFGDVVLPPASAGAAAVRDALEPWVGRAAAADAR